MQRPGVFKSLQARAAHPACLLFGSLIHLDEKATFRC